MISKLKASDFSTGDRVLYVPGHANGNTKHKDCQEGVVSSNNGINVFVRYIRNGVLQSTSQPTDPYDLLLIRKSII